MGIERTGLDIIIRTPGAKESAEELKQLGQATDSFTNEAKKSSPVLDEVADKTEKTTNKKKDLKDSLKQLSHAIPGVHQAMLLLKNPIVILAGAISTLITAFRAYLQSVDELAQSVGIHEAVSKSVTLLGGAFRDAAEGLQQFTIGLGEAAAKEKDLNTELEKNLKLIEEQTRRETELRDAKEALAIEKVNKAEKTGRLAPENAIEQRRIIRDQFAAQREAARRKAEDEAIEAKGETLTKVMESRLRAEVALPGALKEAAIAQRLADAAPKKQESDLEYIGKEQKRWKEQRDDALARRGGFQAGLLDTVAGVAPAGSAAAAGAAALREQQDALIDEATAALAKLDEQEAMVKRGPKRAEKKAEKAANHAEALKSVITGARDMEGTLFEQIVTGKQQNEANRLGRAETTGAERQTRDVVAAGDGEVVMQKRAAAQEAQNVREIEAMVRDAMGGGRGGDVKQAVQSVIQILRETHSDTKGGWMELRQELNDQKREIRDLRGIIKGNRTP